MACCKGFFAQKTEFGGLAFPVGNVCDGCGDHSKSVMHALWLCDQVRSVWLTDLGFLFLVQAKCRTFLDPLEVLFNHGSCYRVALFATMAWCLW